MIRSWRSAFTVLWMFVVVHASAQMPSKLDSCRAAWANTGLSLDERATALSFILYTDTTADALSKAWKLLGTGAPDSGDTLWLRAYAADAMVKARRTGQADDHEGAAKWFAIAAKRYDAIGHAVRGTEARRWCGYALNNLGRFSEAAPYLMAAERGYKQLGDSTGMSDVCCSLGYAFLMQENYTLAKEQFLRGLSYARGRDPFWEFTMLYKIAETEFDAGHFDSSRVYLEHARVFKLAHDDVEDIDDNIASMDADFALRERRCDHALNIFQRILKKQRDEGYGADRICYVVLSVAGAHACAGRHKKAYEMASEGLGIATAIRMPEMQERALRIMANAAEALGRTGEALRLQKRMAAVRDSLERNESLSMLSTSLLGMQVEEQLRADSMSAELARQEAKAVEGQLRANDIEHRMQRINLIVLIAFVVLFAGVLFIRASNNRRIQLEELRTRLSRDLHDDIGSTLSSINILSSVARRKAEAGDEAGAAASISGISERTQRLMRNMSDIVWSVDPERDTLEELLARMREFGAAVLEPKDVAFRFTSSGDFSATVPPVVKSDLYLIFKEAVNNAAKHAQATEVLVTLTHEKNRLRMIISDNGIGLEAGGGGNNGGGNGLRNMRTRAQEVRGELKIESTTTQGTRIELMVPL